MKSICELFFSQDEFLDCLNVRLPKLAENYSLNLIVIDSVAAPLRSEEHTSGKERSQWVRQKRESFNENMFNLSKI